MAETAQLSVRIDLEGNLTSGITKAQRSLAGLNKSVGRVGKGFGQIGAGLSRAGLFVGGAAVAGIGAAAKAAIDFEDAFAGVRKTVDEADLTKVGLSFDKLARTFRDMATEIPIAATEFARLGETAGALGVKAADIDDFVKITALLGVTTDLTADAAADALGRIGTILNFTGKDYAAFADSLVALGNAGASVESEIIEISKRFAGAGRQAGLAVSEITGLASVTASLGFGPERGGTALARVFANMGTNIALANKKGKAFAKVVGEPVKDLIEDLRKGDALGVFRGFLVGLAKLDRIEASKALKAAGITNSSDRQIFVDMAANIDKVDASLLTAKDSVGALAEEARKRFTTVASSIELLKNNLIEAGITLGEGLAPALGRAADKLSAFLKVDATKSTLKEIGEDIGEAIDGIDWEKVLAGARDFVGVMKIALSFTLRIIDALNKLPAEIKAAGAGFLVLNKLSGGLLGEGVGNVVGGLAGAAAQGALGRAPGIGRLFAQPVFVTNFPLGLGGGGLGGAAGGGGLLATAGAIALPVTIAAIGAQAATQLANADLAAKGIKSDFQTPGSGNLPFGIDAALHNIGEAFKAAGARGLPTRDDRATEGMRTTAVATEKVRAATLETKRETAKGAAFITSTTRSAVGSSASQIVGAIVANRPIISVNVSSTSITKVTEVTKRYGVPLASRNIRQGAD